MNAGTANLWYGRGTGSKTPMATPFLRGLKSFVYSGIVFACNLHPHTGGSRVYLRTSLHSRGFSVVLGRWQVQVFALWNSGVFFFSSPPGFQSEAG